MPYCAVGDGVRIYYEDFGEGPEESAHMGQVEEINSFNTAIAEFVSA
jgi:hypothetical protein